MQDPPDLDVHTLRLMKAIADHGSITAAAAALGMSQPAVSQQLTRVEARLGVPVTERVGRRTRLSEAGEVLARHAPAVTTALDAAAGEIAELRGLRSGRVRLVGFPSASPMIVPRLLADLGREHPGITVTYVEAEPPTAVEMVREGRADIALTFSYPGDREDPHVSSAHGLAVHALGTDDLMLVLPAGHPAAAAHAPLSSLADENWVAGCPQCRGHLLELCGRAGFVPRIAMETDNFVAVQNLVAGGIGVGTLPRMAVASFPTLPGVITRPLPHADARTLHVVLAHGAEKVPSHRIALKSVHRQVRAFSDEHSVARSAI